MSGGDKTNSSTQVPVVRCAWVPVAMSHHTRHSMSLSGAQVCSELGHVKDL
jgi:hypothetical protein